MTRRTSLLLLGFSAFSACKGDNTDTGPSAAPHVEITLPEEGATLNASEQVLFEALVSDDVDAPDALGIAWTDEDGALLNDDPADAAGIAGFTWEEPPWGDHVVDLTVTDADGLTSTASVTFTFNNAPPTIDAVQIVPEAPTVSDNLRCTWSGYADPEGDPDQCVAAWLLNGNPAGEGADFPGRVARGDEVTCTVTPYDGYSEGEPLSDVVVIDNNPPVLDGATLSPDPAYEGDTLSCSVGTVSDEDGDPVTFRYAWTVSGVDAGVSGSSLDSDDFDKGDRVVCTVTPTDGLTDGAPVESNAVTIGNTAPTVGTVSLTPAAPTEADTLSCQANASDLDPADSPSLSYAWTVNGSDPGITDSTLDSGHFDKGHEVRCTVTADDGADTGSGQSAPVTVVNAAPVISSVSLTPTAPVEGDTLSCTASASDLDPADTVRLTYAWTVEGSDPGVTSRTLSSSWFSRDQEVTCTVTASDGTAIDVETSATVTVQNSAPTLTGVTLSPDPAYEGDTLTCTPQGGADADGDGVDYSYAWRVDNADPGPTTATLGSTYFDRDQDVNCTVTPDDGDLSGAAVTSADLTISNTPPTAPAVSMSPASPTSADDLVCDLDTASTDADNDSISYNVYWTVDSVTHTGTTTTTTISGDTVPASELSAGEVWQCFMEGDDGTDAGPQGSSAAVAVLPQELIYDITRGDLIDQNSTCSTTAYASVYNGCTGDWGFTWTDTAVLPPVSVTVELNHGIMCSSSTAKAPSLNGVSAGSFSLTGGTCECDPATSVVSWSLTNISGYQVGTTNTFTINAGSSCEGITANPSWGSGIYARVIVGY
ncbi:MAG: hypothetical protein H6739_16095 [Alphaproteobacteria bacterium]|nr:hypothetical protein [Alphaproteobacteria bacterium]